MAKIQKPDPKKFATIGKLKEIIAKNNSDKKYIEDKRKAYGTDMSNADEDDIKDQVRLSQIEDQNYRYGNLIKKANKAASANKATPDSTNIYQRKMLSNMSMADRSKGQLKETFIKKYNQDATDLIRQSKKGKPGYDKNGYPLKNVK